MPLGQKRANVAAGSNQKTFEELGHQFQMLGEERVAVIGIPQQALLHANARKSKPFLGCGPRHA